MVWGTIFWGHHLLNLDPDPKLRITCRMTLLLLLCFIRCATFLVEQPISTLMTFFPYIRWLEKVVSAFFPWLSTHLYLA